MSKSAVNTNVKPPSDFIEETKRYKVRFDLVKKNFEESYPDYRMGSDFTKKNVRTRKNWDELITEMNSNKLAIRGKSDEYNSMVERLSKSIDSKRKNFLNKTKQDKMNSQILTSAEPLKIQKYDENLKAIVETIYYSIGIIIMGSYIAKMFSK
tara:strand:+ start:203 stop:661 length:459 start_codon:yes stop_codon:yes gene_type:complete